VFHEQSFIDYISLERRFSVHTRQAYLGDLSQFRAFGVDEQCLTSFSEVRHSHIRAWVVSKLEAGEQPRSITRRLSCLKTYFHFLKKRGIVDKDPMKKVLAPRFGKKLPEYLQESQVTALFTHIDFGTDFGGQQDRLLLELLYATGMRRSEAAQVRLQDIDLDRMVIRVAGKGGRERFSPVPRYLADLFPKHIETRRAMFPGTDQPWLFLNRKGEPLSPESIYYVVKKYLSIVSSADQRSPHVLRHSFATHLSNAGADLNAIKELLGHANLAATQIYMHNNIERLREVYEKAHPKGEE
jgi:integrase/recombinase XerC